MTKDNDKLPEDVILEIFSAYRQLCELQPDYETLWNSKDGWMKLAHVCLHWRRVVLGSSTHLRLRLLFTPRRSSKAPMLKSLPSFPILVDYSATSWTEKEENLALAAVRHRSRVRGITLRGPSCPASLLKALSHPFPELESLRICPSYSSDREQRELVLPATLLSGSAPRLRRLTLRGVEPTCISPLLSVATGLVELDLTLNSGDNSRPVPSILPNLQRMPCLRRLELHLEHHPNIFHFLPDPPPSAQAGVVVPLPKLTHLTFTGHKSYLQALVAGLAAPSLQYFTATLLGQSNDGFPISRLCKFIRDTECQFTAVEMVFSRTKLEFYAATGSQSADDKHFRMTVPVPISLEQLALELAGPLATVKELIIAWDVEPWFTEPIVHADEWHRFFHHVPQVKSAQVSGEVALDIAHSFQQHGQEPAMNLLPTLQQLEVRSLVGEGDHYATIRDAYEPLVAARERAGRLVKFSWSLWSYRNKEQWLVRY